MTPKSTSSVHNIGVEKPPFGSRFLEDESDVWSQNAWDHVPPPDDQEEIITASLTKQRLAPVPDDDKPKYNEKPARHWFVLHPPPTGSIHAAVWDLTSPEGLPDDIVPGTVDIVILVFVFSALHPDEWGRAIANIHRMLKPGGLVVMRDYGRHDLTQLRFKSGRLLDENFYIRGDKTRVYFFELDELALLFTGSQALSTQITDRTTEEVDDDDAQPSDASSHTPISRETSQTPQESLISEPVPSTSSSSAHAPGISNPILHPTLLVPLANCPAHPLFSTEQLGVDRRLLVNRKRQLKMYRVWMQGKFRKIS
ncbi:hypothetical protein DXG03_001042 [Asterophora parasitica]|uniref:tRNA N(3)-methylcytidine methyltransferase n=1 Tax=Asterophora parasitica TaxID=117018 RepID=A0A9P7G9X0_9AGAR|nr:hypothetical protein DXG03_001042 [Asterophora parasitica]